MLRIIFPAARINFPNHNQFVSSLWHSKNFHCNNWISKCIRCLYIGHSRMCPFQRIQTGWNSKCFLYFVHPSYSCVLLVSWGQLRLFKIVQTYTKKVFKSKHSSKWHFCIVSGTFYGLFVHVMTLSAKTKLLRTKPNSNKLTN